MVEALISLDLIVVLIGAAIAGVMADKLKQPTLVAYLLAGIIAGPAVLSYADPTQLIELMAELGLAFLLFLIGLKLDFGEIEHIYRPVLKISIPQMIAVMMVAGFTAYLTGFGLVSSIILGAAFMYSSTAVVVKLLNDSGGIQKQYGKINTGILLIQDLAVVILMVLITSADSGIISGLLPAFGFLLAAVFFTVLASKTVLPRLLKEASKDSINLFVTGLAWLFLFILAAEQFGLSIEVGAFIAGLGLGQIKYSTELVERMSPVTDFFIAMFFVNFGLNLSLGEFLTYWKEAIILSTILMVTKYFVISKLVDWQGFNKETSFKSGLTMTQTSEFSLIFAAAAASAGLLTGAEVGLISLVAIITMSLSSYLILFHNQIFDRLYPQESTLDSETDRENHAIIAGYVEGLEDIIEILEKEFEEVIILDNDPAVGDGLESFMFGDFHHRGLREQLGVHKAGFVMINFEDESLVKEVSGEMESGVLLAKSSREIKDVQVYAEEKLLVEKLEKYLEEADI